MAPLERRLRYQHWADVTTHTNPCELADGYVFVKQSGTPSYCTL